MATSLTGYNIDPLSWSEAYGGRPNIPLTTQDTKRVVGTDKLKQLVENQPLFEKNLGTYTGNIASGLAGQLSTGTTNLLAQKAAEWGAGSGLAMSPAVATGLLNRYGLTSEQLQATAGSQYMDLMTKWPFTEESTQTDTTDQSVLAAIYRSAPDPAAAAAAANAAAKSGVRAGSGGITMPASGSPLTPVSATSGIGYDPGVAFQNAWYNAHVAPATAAAQAQTDAYNTWLRQNAWDPTAAYESGEDTSYNDWLSELGYDTSGYEIQQGQYSDYGDGSYDSGWGGYFDDYYSYEGEE